MPRRFSEDADRFLLAYHNIPGGPGFVASHDLGFTEAAGKARFKKLAESGAWAAYVEEHIARIHFRLRSGRSMEDPAHELAKLNEELAEARAAIKQPTPA